MQTTSVQHRCHLRTTLIQFKVKRQVLEPDRPPYLSRRLGRYFTCNLDYIDKPFDKEMVEEIIEEKLQKKSLKQQVENFWT